MLIPHVAEPGQLYLLGRVYVRLGSPVGDGFALVADSSILRDGGTPIGGRFAGLRLTALSDVCQLHA